MDSFWSRLLTTSILTEKRAESIHGIRVDLNTKSRFCSATSAMRTPKRRFHAYSPSFRVSM